MNGIDVQSAKFIWFSEMIFCMVHGDDIIKGGENDQLSGNDILFGGTVNMV